MLIADTFPVSEFKLTDMLGAAGATIGVIIAGVIFLQFLSSKYTELAGRYREFTEEYRKGEAGEGRHNRLQSQIRLYHRRLRLLLRASWLAGIAVMLLITSIFAGGVSRILPEAVPIKWLGAGALFVGLALVAVGVLLELIESIDTRHEIGEEVGDLDDPAKSQSLNSVSDEERRRMRSPTRQVAESGPLILDPPGVGTLFVRLFTVRGKTLGD
jgi:hypothetical protein